MRISNATMLSLNLMLQGVISSKNVSHVPVLTGEAGIGKTSISKEIAENVGGIFGCIDLTQTKEGDILGVPIPMVNKKTNIPEMFFAHHPTIIEIKTLEEANYEKAKANISKFAEILNIDESTAESALISMESFRELLGTVDKMCLLRLLTPTNLNRDLFEVIKQLCKPNNDIKADDLDIFELNKLNKTTIEILLGKSVENIRDLIPAVNSLTGEEKLRILEIKSHIIPGFFQPYVLMLDELNRAERAVKQEAFNILLSRTISGYHLPFFVLIIGAKNPETDDYAVEDLNDKASNDRIYDIPVSADSEDFVKYGVEHNVHPDILEFIIQYPEFLSKSGAKGTDEKIVATNFNDKDPTPRSWECVSDLLYNFDSQDIRKFVNENIAIDSNHEAELIRNAIQLKVGQVATAEFFKFRESKRDNIDIPAIFANNVKEVPKEALNKYNKYVQSKQIYFSSRIIRYIAEKWATASDTEKKTICNKINQFVEVSTPSTIMSIYKAMATTPIKGSVKKLTQDKTIALNCINTIFGVVVETDRRILN